LDAIAADLDKLRATATASFRSRFPSPRGWLFDTVDGPGDDASLRPNQLLAYGLPYAPLRDADPAAVRAIGQALLTPLGLRSLAPGEPGYVGRHQGDPASRDHAYHQGTVWPWLIGPYVDAAIATGLSVSGVLDGLFAHLGEWGVGSVRRDRRRRRTTCRDRMPVSSVVRRGAAPRFPSVHIGMARRHEAQARPARHLQPGRGHRPRIERHHRPGGGQARTARGDHPGKGSGQLKKRVLRFLEQKEIKALYHRVEKDSDNFGRIFVHFRWTEDRRR
jgi:hypothetical protein